MIYRAIEKFSKREVLGVLNPLVTEWFNLKFRDLTPPQRYGIIPINKGENVLISSPTGTGKTLTAFLSIISELFNLATQGKLENRVYCIYISPLRALSNDIYRNLEEPLREIKKLAEEKGVEIPEIRHSVRTGDTSSYEKQKMLRKTPHILITTPESLSIVLNAKRFREKIMDVRWVIVDEIHSLCENKRGVHLSLSLERLQYWCKREFVRIGLSATIAPLENVAKFLVGYRKGKLRDCCIVDTSFIKEKEIEVVSPSKDLIYESAGEVTRKMYDMLTQLIKEHRTTLIFTNTRSGTERVVFHLKQHLPRQIEEIDEYEIAAHHGSLSRPLRFDVEERMKMGRLKAVVCVTGDSLVLTNPCWKKIREMKPWNEIICLDEQLKLRKGRFKSVFSAMYRGSGFKIRSKLGFEIKCTPEHKFLTIEDSKLVWKEAKDINIGDKIGVIGRTPVSNFPFSPLENHRFKSPLGFLFSICFWWALKLFRLINWFSLKTWTWTLRDKFWGSPFSSDVLWDRVVEKRSIHIGKIWSLVDTTNHNYVINGFICQNSSTSLELGIDIGYIDLVVQIGSPKSVTRCLQRIGRSGHALHDVTRGVLICMDLDDLVECAVMVKEAYKNHLDRARIPRKCLDVLSQHLLGMAINRKWTVKEALEVIRGSYSYRDLKESELVNVLTYLSGGYSQLESHKVYGKVWFDPEEGVFGRRGKYARVIYSLNIGTIPDEVMIKVYTTNKKYVGNIEEEFLQRLIKGDRFVLGGGVYEFVSARGARVKVKPAFDSKPTVPRWFSEQLPLSYDLAVEIGRFREEIFSFLTNGVEEGKVVEYIVRECRTDVDSATLIYRYFLQEYLFLKAMGIEEFPSHRNILKEKFLDEEGRLNIVYHTLFGRRVNDALSRACAYLAGEKTKRNIGVAVSDNGFILILPVEKEINPLEELLQRNLREVLMKAVRKTELMKRKFRHCGVRSLMILRNYKGHEIGVNKQQISASTLLKVSEEIKDFPVLKETYREILEDTMDVEHAEEVLEKLRKGEMKIIGLETDVPSPFAHNIVLIGMSDIVLMEDRREVLKRLHEMVVEKINVHGKEGEN